MKVSEVIERALATTYGPMFNQEAYMCHAIPKVKGIAREDSNVAIYAVQQLVESISPCNISLMGALDTQGYLEECNGTIEVMDYMAQLYVWWVFDLKRKGL